MRKRFDDELRHLNDLVLEMASLNERGQTNTKRLSKTNALKFL